MVSPGTFLSALSMGLTLKDRAEEREMKEQIDREIPDTGPQANIPADIDLQRQQLETLEELVEHKRQNEPGPNDRDAFASTTLSLLPGETAVVTVEPTDGYNMKVEEIRFDRRGNHSYRLNVAGDVTSVSHRARYAKPKSVRQSDRVVGEVTNNSGSQSVIDFELVAWAEPGGR